MPSSLQTGPHLPECTQDKVDGLTVYICASGCQAMASYLVQPGETTGEVDTYSINPDSMSRGQIEAVTDIIRKRTGL